MAPKPKSLVRTLSRRGPHRVLRGDLAFAGMPGIVCAPESGFSLPAVVFGHGWLTAPERYLNTLAHLASWGIVAVAPATSGGAVPSARTFATDLCTAADIAVGVRLGPGNISVHPDRVAMAGHGFGAGAAVLAAAGFTGPAPLSPVTAARGGQSPGPQTPFDPKARRPIAALAALYPAPTSPPAPPAAARLDIPALVLAEPGEHGGLAPEAAALAEAHGGEATARVVPAAADATIVDHNRLAKFLGLPGSDRALQATRFEQASKGQIARQLIAFIAARYHQS